MIQRIQTVWLFLAALVSSLLMLDWYTGYVYKADIPHGFGSVVKRLTVTEHFPSLIVAVVMTIIPLIAIFMFRNRKQQRTFVFTGMVSAVAFAALNLMRINNFTVTHSPAPSGGSYQPGSVLPVFVLFFLILALRGINRDNKLVKSMDRLR